MSFYFDSDDFANLPPEEEQQDEFIDNQDEEGLEGEEPDTEDFDDDEIDEPETDDESGEYNLTVKGKNVKLSQTELEDAIDNYVNSSSDADYKLYKETKPLMDTLRRDNAMREYFKLSQEGYKPGDILWTLLDQYRPDLTNIVKQSLNGGQQQQIQQDEPPIFDTIEAETNYYIEKKLKEHLAPINQTLQQFGQYQQTRQQQEQLQRIGQNNDYLVAQAIEQGGYTYDANALRDTVAELYPGVDARQLQLTPQMANRLVQMAFGTQKNTKKANKRTTDLSALTKQSKLPNLLGGNAGTSRKGEAPKHQLPSVGKKMERIKQVDDLWDKL